MLVSHEENLCLREIDATTENNNQSKSTVVVPSPNGHIHCTTLEVVTQTSLLKKKDGRLQKPENGVCEFSLEMSRGTAIKSHQHGYLNMTGTRTIQIGMLMWTKKAGGTHGTTRN